MTNFDEFNEVANQILAGDISIVAAQKMEAAVIQKHFDDERFEELQYALAMYIPGGDRPYYNSERLRTEILRTLKRLT